MRTMHDEMEETADDFNMSNVEDGDSNDVESSPKAKFTRLRYSKEDYKAFKDIDREAEDNLVTDFHKTKSTDTLLKLLRLREPTLLNMARRYASLDNEDDMYAEFKKVWLQCVKKYNGKAKLRHARDSHGELLFMEDGQPQMVLRHTPFNTYLYTSMRNRIGNIMKRLHSKRLLDGNGNPVWKTMRSLDFQIGDDEDMTLQDVIQDENTQQPWADAEANEIKVLLGADKDPDISRAIDRFYENSGLTSLTDAACLRIGTLRLTKLERQVLAIGVTGKHGDQPSFEMRRKAMTYLKHMIESSKTYDKFEVVNFSLNHNSVNFLVKVNNAALVKKVKEAMSKCKDVLNQRVVVQCES